MFNVYYIIYFIFCQENCFILDKINSGVPQGSFLGLLIDVSLN